MTARAFYRERQHSLTCCNDRQVRLLAFAISAAAAIVFSSGTLHAQSATSACTRAFGEWVAQRDAKLQRLEAAPTLLGLDNTWCTPSQARVSELRAQLVHVQATCTGVAGDEKARVDSLIVRSGLLLDRVKLCAAQAVVAEADTSWTTSVRQPPAAKPVAQAPVAEKPVKVAKAVVAPRDSADPASSGEPAPKQKQAQMPREAQAAKKADADKAQGAAVRKDDVTKPVVVAAAPVQPAAADDTFDGLKRYAVQAEGRAAPPAEDEDCLVVTRTSPASYLIENKNCRPQIILTAIELNKPGQGIRCFTKKISDGIAIAGEGEHAPQINFQCREGSQGCAEGMLRGMFPECQPG